MQCLLISWLTNTEELMCHWVLVLKHVGEIFILQGSVRTAWPLLSPTAPSAVHRSTLEDMEPAMPNSTANKVRLSQKHLQLSALCVCVLYLLCWDLVDLFLITAKRDLMSHLNVLLTHSSFDNICKTQRKPAGRIQTAGLAFVRSNNFITVPEPVRYWLIWCDVSHHALRLQ